MQVSVEKISNLERKLTISIPAQEVRLKEDTKRKELSKQVKIAGFRSGKVPSRVIDQRYGKQIRSEIVEKLVIKSLEEAISQEKLEPATNPNIENIDDKVNEDLKFVAIFEVFPDFTLADLSEMQLEKPCADITDSDVEKGILHLQEQFASKKVVEREAKNGDIVTIDFTGSIDGQPFEGNAAKDFALELGSKQLINGFEDGLLGIKAEENKDLDLVFPEEYPASELAGKQVKFVVAVKKVEEKELAKLDSDFAKRIGINDGNVDEISSKVKANMERFLSESVQKQMQNKAIEALIKLNPVEVPGSLITAEKKTIIEEMKQRSGNSNIQLSDDEAKKVEKEATRRSTSGILLKKVIKIYDLKVDSEIVNRKISELSAMFGGAEKFKKLYHESKGLLQEIQSTVLSEQAIEFVIEKANITEKKSTFYDITSRSA